MKKWVWQCTECDETYESKKDEHAQNCIGKNHELMRVPTEEYAKIMKQESKKEQRYTYQTKAKDKQITKEILDHKIQVLRPQTLLPNTNWKMILVYLPTKKEVVKGSGDGATTSFEFVNSAYFVISRPKNSIRPEREILPFDHESLIDKFKISVLSEWNDVRWDVKDCKRWEEESTKSDPCELYNLHDETTKKYLEFATDFEYVKFNLWNIATYVFELFDAFPYNDFIGTKRAGKTKSLEFQKLACFNAIMSPDMTSSALFRIVEGLGSTILLDESEEFKNKKNEQAQAVRNLLMQGFLKDQHAVRNETTKDKNFTPTQYNLFSPKSLAHINALDDVLEDRCIEQIQRRALDEEIRNRWCTNKDPSYQIIRNKCYRLFLDYADEIDDLKEMANSELDVSGRELQLWTPIITLALFFEKHGISGLVHAIKRNVAHTVENRQLSDEQESRDLKVLGYLYDFGITVAQDEVYLKTNPKGWIAIGELYKHFYSKFDEYDINPDYFSRRTLSQTLKRFGFNTERKVAGISWLITENEVGEVRKRMGYSEASDASLDGFAGGSDIDKKGTEGTEGTGLGTKSEESANFQNYRNVEETTADKQPPMPKPVVNEGNVVNVPKVGGRNQADITHESVHPVPSVLTKNTETTGTTGSTGSTGLGMKSEEAIATTDQAKNNDKGEQDEVSKINETSHASQSSPSSHIESIANYTYWECLTCNTGLREMYERTSLSGNIFEFHQKSGHSVKPYTESEAKEHEENRRKLL